MKPKVQQEIERLVDKYSPSDNRDIFRLKLEYLVLMAEREQMRVG